MIKRIQFADTGAEVSAMALGCLPFGSKLDKERSFELLNYFDSQGGNFLDTSNNYSFWDADGKGGESENVLGEWMRIRGNRKDIFLATKLGAFPTVSRDEFFSYEGNPWADKTEGLSKKAVLAAIDGSLKRLGTDHVDLLYAHVDDRTVNQEETLDAFAEIIKQGKARFIGSSNFKVWRLARARTLARERGLPVYKAVQMFHTYFQSEKFADTGMADQMGDELFDYVRSGNEMALLAYTPLLWGSYTRPEKYDEIDRLKSFVRPQNDERRRRLERVAAETGRSVNEVIYAWMMQSAPRIIPLVAVSRLEHLKEDLAAANLTLTPEQMGVLDAPLN